MHLRIRTATKMTGDYTKRKIRTEAIRVWSSDWCPLLSFVSRPMISGIGVYSRHDRNDSEE